jgi:large subunit ribosomal protein L15
MAHVKRRRKSTRFRGSKTHARGFKKKARGSGHQGGVGMAGSGKRGDQKKTLILNLFGNDYFGKDKTLRRGTVAPKLKSMNLGSISEDIHSFVKKGIAKDNKGTYEVDLKGYKILGEGELTIKAHIKASAASKSAFEKIKASGSTIEFAYVSKVQQKS